MEAVTRSLAMELGPRHIRVNAINPGMVETEGTHAAGITDSDFRRQVESQTPLGRIGQPQDIGPAAVFLPSADSSMITGETPHHGRLPLSGVGMEALFHFSAASPSRGSPRCTRHLVVGGRWAGYLLGR